MKDSLMEDGLVNPYDNKPMGVIGEICAKKYNFSKEEQNEFAKRSYKKNFETQKSSYFKEEITPVILETKKGDLI